MERASTLHSSPLARRHPVTRERHRRLRRLRLWRRAHPPVTCAAPPPFPSSPNGPRPPPAATSPSDHGAPGHVSGSSRGRPPAALGLAACRGIPSAHCDVGPSEPAPRLCIFMRPGPRGTCCGRAAACSLRRLKHRDSDALQTRGEPARRLA